MIRVIVNGAKGKMGAETVRAVEADAALLLVAAAGKKDNLTELIRSTQADVVVDFTHPACVKANAKAILTAGARPVIGTTGLSEKDIQELEQLTEEKRLGTLIVPNFAIGAVLMMKFAQEAAKYMDRVEIIEFHHDKKADAPSGTAIKTAELMAQSHPEINAEPLEETEVISGARGGAKHRIPIHSVRMPGYVAHQEVLFGGLGQTLSLRHDTISRISFMPGVLLSIKKIGEIQGLVYGLEHLF